jgi:hypothetical protein
MLFFIDLHGKPISLKSAYDNAVAEEVFQVMGVPQYSARRATATRMLQLDLEETVPTCLSQAKTTQRTIYAEDTEEQGINSKLLANKEIFSYEAAIESGSDSKHEAALRKQAEENLELGQEDLANSWQKADWKNFTSDTQGRGPTRRSLAEERFPPSLFDLQPRVLGVVMPLPGR